MSLRVPRHKSLRPASFAVLIAAGAIAVGGAGPAAAGPPPPPAYTTPSATNTQVQTRPIQGQQPPSGEGTEMARLLALVLGLVVLTVLIPVQLTKRFVSRRRRTTRVVSLVGPRQTRGRDT
jgi:hypothetical protein